MPQDANRSRRDVRAYGWICLVGVTVAVVAAVLMWDGNGQNDVSIIFLVLAALLLPLLLLLRRDALRRDEPTGGTEITQAPTAVPIEQREGVDQSGQIVVTRPAGFYQDALRRYKILIDGQEAGSLKRGESLRRTVQAGRHDVVAKIDWSGSPTAQVDVPPGGTVTLRVGPGSPLGGFFSSDEWLTLSVDS